MLIINHDIEINTLKKYKETINDIISSRKYKSGEGFSRKYKQPK